MGGRLWLLRRSDVFVHCTLRVGELEKGDGGMAIPSVWSCLFEVLISGERCSDGYLLSDAVGSQTQYMHVYD
jgi:hypothetical protein